MDREYELPDKGTDSIKPEYPKDSDIPIEGTKPTNPVVPGDTIDPSDPPVYIIKGRLEKDIFGITLIIDNINKEKIDRVTLNGKLLEGGPPKWNYGFDGSKLRIAINEEVKELIIRIDGTDYLVEIEE